MNVDSILISNFAIVDRGKLTVVGVFNHIITTETPAVFPQLSVSLVIHGHSSEAGTSHELEIRLINARREPIRDPLFRTVRFSNLAIPGLPLRLSSVSTIFLPKFEEVGLYAFEVYIDGTYHASASFYVGPEPEVDPEGQTGQDS